MKKTAISLDDQTAEAMRDLLLVAKLALDYFDGQDYLHASAIVYTARQRLRAAARMRPAETKRIDNSSTARRNGGTRGAS